MNHLKENTTQPSFINKLSYLLSPSQKRMAAVLAILMFIGMLFEMGGLGILLPILSLMLKPNIGDDYPALQPLLDFLGNPSQSKLVLYGLLFLVFFYLIKSAFLTFMSWKQSKFSAELSEKFSTNLFKGYLSQPYSFYLQRNSAELLRNIQIEVNHFTLLSGAVIILCIEFSQIFGLVVILILAEPVGAIGVSIFMFVASHFFNMVTKKRLTGWGKLRQHYSEHMNQHLIQGLNGVKDLKLLGREEYFLRQFNQHNILNSKISAKVGTLYLIPRLYFEMLAIIGISGMVLVMVLQGKDLSLLVPTLGIFAAAGFRMIPSFNRVVSSMQQVQYGKPVIDVLYKEFKDLRSREFFKNSERIQPFTQFVNLVNVDYQYNGSSTKSLKNINIQIYPGESIGFIGPSGSGKSTLIDLLLGLLSPSNGQILVDGNDIQDCLREWQNNIGYVPQNIYLTDDSLRKNIAFGIDESNIDQGSVDRAIKAAQLGEFVENLPLGLDTFVGERGVRLSGGQRQRIGIARALYHDPSILVLDEATSALDSTTEDGVMEAINALHGRKTIIIVAHRLTTVKSCDRLYSLEKGEIIAEGTPNELIPF